MLNMYEVVCGRQFTVSKVTQKSSDCGLGRPQMRRLQDILSLVIRSVVSKVWSGGLKGIVGGLPSAFHTSSIRD